MSQFLHSGDQACWLIIAIDLQKWCLLYDLSMYEGKKVDCYVDAIWYVQSFNNSKHYLMRNIIASSL